VLGLTLGLMLALAATWRADGPEAENAKSDTVPASPGWGREAITAALQRAGPGQDSSRLRIRPDSREFEWRQDLCQLKWK
jgi:hypothetical protein